MNERFSQIVVFEQRIRSDTEGSGLWHAPRGNRLHKGVDLVCVPGREVFSPISGTFVRIARPYADDASYGGIVIAGKWCTVKMFYLSPLHFTPGEFIREGQQVGVAQDVSKRYSPKMTPHIHVQIEEIDPLIFITLTK